METNQVYAEIVRPLGGNKFEYQTFAPRELASGAFDIELKARDSVKLYTTVPGAGTKQGIDTTTTTPAASVATVAVPVAAGTATTPSGEAGGSAATQGMAAAPVTAPGAPAGTVSAAPTALATTNPGSQGNLSDASTADLSRFLDVVSVSGAVRYAGPYARTPTLKLSSVITADQMLETTNLEYAELTRLKEDGSYEYATFAPKDVLEKKYDLTLKARDTIRLVTKTTFGGTLALANVEKFADLVQLTGQVARPEIYALRVGMKLSQLLTKDQVLLDTNLNYAEVVRLKADGKNEYVTFRPSEVLGGSWDFELGARDVIRLVTVGYAPAKPDFDRFMNAVQLTGPVQFAGLYAWREGDEALELVGLGETGVGDETRSTRKLFRPLGGNKF